MASSTTVATSAARCWASQLEGYTTRRSRRAMSNSVGTATRATAVSGNERLAMIATDSTKSRTFPLMNGR